MSKLRITAKKTSGTYSRIIYLCFKNVSKETVPKQNYSLKVKEGNRVVHQADYHIVGPLGPREVEEHPIPGPLKRGLFTTQLITIEVEDVSHHLSVGAFG